jgi:hypothetical protein
MKMKGHHQSAMGSIDGEEIIHTMWGFDLVITVSVGSYSLENNWKSLEETTSEQAVCHTVTQGKRSFEVLRLIHSVHHYYMFRP